jgi:NTE family protein
MAKKTALILSGGGAKGAFQCAAERYAREVAGYHWDIIAGVSAGALNGVMLAMEKYDRLWEIWSTISNDQVYTGGFSLWSAIKVAFGAKSFYGNDPLRELLMREFEPERINADLRVGAVSLITGQYTQFTSADPNFAEAVLASTVMPIIWEPLDVSERHPSMVDGGVRNISPIGDVLDAEPDEIVIMNCDPEEPGVLPAPPKDIVQIGTRALELVLNELFVSDVREFLDINHLVQDAAERGITLYSRSGKPLKYYEFKIIQPDTSLGDTLDFTQTSVQRSLRAGAIKARQVLG